MSNTLKKIHPLIKLLIWTVILGSVTYLVTENPFQFTDIVCHYILYGTVCFIIIFLLLSSSTIANHEGEISWSELLLYLVPRLVAYASTILLMVGEAFRFYEINFWICLTSWVVLFYYSSCIASIGESFDRLFSSLDKEKEQNKEKTENNIGQLILAISAAWSIALIFITLGTTIFNYGKHPIQKLQEIHTLLDLRINLVIVVGILIAFKSMVTVIQTKKIEIKQPFNPKEKKTDSNDKNKIISIFFSGFYIFINLGISLIASLGNVFYKFIATICVYFYYVGGEIFSSISSLIKKSVNLVFFLLTLIAIISTIYFANIICTHLLEYMRANSISSSIIPLLWVFIFTGSISVSLITINYFTTIEYNFFRRKLQRDEDAYNEKLSQVMQTIPILVFSTLIIGVLLFSLSQTDLLKFTYFKTFGLVSGLLSAIVSVGFFIYLIDNFRSKPESKTEKSSFENQEKKANANVIKVVGKIDLDKVDDRTTQEIWEHKPKRRNILSSLFKPQKNEPENEDNNND